MYITLKLQTVFKEDKYHCSGEEKSTPSSPAQQGSACVQRGH